ncbi:MAG: NFACT family protein [Defluviitaleaceae bacterium]|nr:NFACT family protein [Defluviitaleaceae bacterium]
MLDGIIVANIKHELCRIVGGRIDKIYQPNKDEIVLTVRAGGANHKLILSANATAPRIHFTKESFENPASPPMFCMQLRKHISGRIVSVTQPNFDRIIEIQIESADELKYITTKRLIIEIMGKHSNIILVNDKNIIINSIKHINSTVSSVREVMPGKPYAPPPNQNKTNFLELEKEILKQGMKNHSENAHTAIYKTFTGISPKIAALVCTKANVDPDFAADSEKIDFIYSELENLKEDIINARFSPYVVVNKENKKNIKAIHTIYPWAYSGFELKYFEDISAAIEYFYIQREQNYRITQKTADLRKLVQQTLSRNIKKQEKFFINLKEIKNRDELKLYGELITANIHAIEKGVTSFTTPNFYAENMEDIKIQIDPTLSPAENAQQYFKQYNKQKRSYTATIEQIKESEAEQNYLESVLATLQGDLNQKEIEEIREELVEQKILKKRNKTKDSGKSLNTKSQPLKFVSMDGFVIFVGKNNKQNDTITTNAQRSDMWLHTKDIPGSHVIIKSEGKEIPDTTITQAAKLAAYYSAGVNSNLVAVDYTQKKYVKKPNGAKPGMVIYTHHKTAFVEPVANVV